MMSRFTRQLIAACVVASVVGIRRGKRSGVGFVDSLYVYGSPEIGKPALTSFGGCFKGRAVVGVRNSKDGVQLIGGKDADLVSVVGQNLGYEGAHIELQELDVGDGNEDLRACPADGANKVRGHGRFFGIHHWDIYFRIVKESGATGAELAYAHFGLYTAAQKEWKVAKVGVEKFGWRLVASANHPGGGFLAAGGPQVSHLIQHPDTLDCVVTFMYTDSIGDWWNNLQGASRRWCGLPGDRRPGWGRVHRGLANALDLTVNSTEWQAKVRPNLRFCRKVISTGHSQGGAQAELFAACMNQDPPSGSSQYNSMKWVQAEPKQLDYL